MSWSALLLAAAGCVGPVGLQGPPGDPGEAGQTGQTGPQGASGAPGQPGASVDVSVAPEPAGANCAAGGYRLIVSPDGRDPTIAYVCNGVAGQSARVQVSAEDPGQNCPAGGQRLSSSVGDAAPVDAYVCNGSTSNSGSSPVVVSAEGPGENCPDGGVRLSMSTSVQYVCNGARGASGVDGRSVAASVEAPGDACPFGGIRLESATGTNYVCQADDGRLLGVSAGADQSVVVGATVSLAGTLGPSVLGARWQQILGPPIVLDDPESLRATFVAPDFADRTRRRVVLELRGTDGEKVESDLMVVTLNRPLPTVSVTVTPTVSVAGRDVACRWSGPVDDADGAPVSYTVSWTREGAPFTEGVVSDDAWSSRIPGALTRPGDVFVCSVSVSTDGGQASVQAEGRVARCNDPAAGGCVVGDTCLPTSGLCTRTRNLDEACATDAPCGGGLACVTVGTTARCLAECTANTCGAGTSCLVTGPQGRRFCAVSCAADTDCNSGTVCLGVGTGTTRACVPAPTPGLTGVAAVSSVLVFNELYAGPPTATGVDYDRFKFVELYNPGVSPVDLTGWKLMRCADASCVVSAALNVWEIKPQTTGASLVVAPGSYAVIGGAALDVAALGVPAGVLIARGTTTTLISDSVTRSTARAFGLVSPASELVSSYGAWMGIPTATANAGRSFERRDPASADVAGNWTVASSTLPGSTTAFASPGRRNSAVGLSTDRVCVDACRVDGAASCGCQTDSDCTAGFRCDAAGLCACGPR